MDSAAERPAGLPLAGTAERSRSGNPSWQRIARSYRIENAAQRFEIPERSWNHPTIHSFVETTLDADDLQRALSLSEGRHSYAPHLREEGIPAGAPGMNPSLVLRYTDGELLMRAVGGILDYGLGGLPANYSGYLKGKVGIVTKRFGVMVTHVPEEATQIPQMQIPVALPGSAWADFKFIPQADLFERYVRLYGAGNVRAKWMDTPREKDIDQERVRSISTAKRIGIPEENLSNPTVREFITNIHEVEDLLNTFEQGEPPPGAPGLTPSVAVRYTMAAHLMQVAKAIMEEGFHGRAVDPQFVASHVTHALSYFGLQARLQIK